MSGLFKRSRSTKPLNEVLWEWLEEDNDEKFRIMIKMYKDSIDQFYVKSGYKE